VDLRSGQLRPHRPSDLLTKLAPVAFDNGATCPRWERFVGQLLGGDRSVVGYVQRLIGYSLTGLANEHVLAIFHGEGANGKSTLLSTLLRLLGEYAWQAPAELLLATRNEQHPTALSDLQGRRLVVISETDSGRRLNGAQLKTLTGGDTVTSRRMRADYTNFRPTHTLMMATNHLPTPPGRDHGTWRRLKPIRCPLVVASHNMDRELGARLRSELPGILNWAIEGCLEWQRRGLDEPDVISRDAEQYKRHTDPLGPFLDERCIIGDEEVVQTNDLYAAYRDWCEESGQERLSQRALGPQLRARGMRNGKHGPRRTIAWFGIGLNGPPRGNAPA
jgi:putative DNA primase/helicase